MDRRKFIKTGALLTGGIVLGVPRILGKETVYPDLVMVKNGQPAEMARKALDMLGGISRFIAKGDSVLLKPNLSWDRAPEYAATTNPELVAEIVRQCYQAGAKKVVILDNTCNDARRSYDSCKIPEYAKVVGADVRFVRDNQFVETPIPGGTHLTSWLIHQEVFNADKLINIPILKHHGISGITSGFKNMMGLLGGQRGRIHRPYAESIVDLNRVIVPNLTIIDAFRILRRNGPSGGNLNDVEQLSTILAGTDRVLVDAWAAKIFGIDPQTLDYLRLAHSAGMGQIDINKYQPIIYTFKT
ncbi:MAG: DUF362 domain-containing protein [bacterium]